jgi:hypothetical protein
LNSRFGLKAVVRYDAALFSELNDRVAYLGAIRAALISPSTNAAQQRLSFPSTQLDTTPAMASPSPVNELEGKITDAKICKTDRSGNDG